MGKVEDLAKEYKEGRVTAEEAASALGSMKFAPRGDGYSDDIVEDSMAEAAWLFPKKVLDVWESYAGDGKLLNPQPKDD